MVLLFQGLFSGSTLVFTEGFTVERPLSLQASFLRLLQEEIAKMSTEREEKSEREERWEGSEGFFLEGGGTVKMADIVES